MECICGQLIKDLGKLAFFDNSALLRDTIRKVFLKIEKSKSITHTKYM